MNEFAIKLTANIAERDRLERRLAIEGRRVLARLRKRTSLRGVARASGLSATYLSRVANKGAIISPGAFLTLSRLEQFLRYMPDRKESK